MSTRFEELEPKYMFEELGWEYKYENNLEFNCEDVIAYTHTITGTKIQFNLLSKIVVISSKVNKEVYSDFVIFLSKEILLAINKQTEELGWE